MIASVVRLTHSVALTFFTLVVIFFPRRQLYCIHYFLAINRVHWTDVVDVTVDKEQKDC